jgi:hypothetical protein
MSKPGVVVTIACALAAGLPVAASSAGDPLAQPKADLVKLTADASAAEASVAADAKSSDIAQLKRDAKAGLAALKADGKVLLFDAAVARKAGADKTDLRSLLQAARTQVKEFRSAVRSAFAEARKTAKPNKGSKGSKGNSSSRGSDDVESGG